MQLKMEANTEPRKRFHLLSRLRKAVKHGEELERLCDSDRVDAKTKLEAQVLEFNIVVAYKICCRTNMDVILTQRRKTICR